MHMREAFVNLFIRFILLFICKIDYGDLEKIPKKGPLILFGNHINFLDAPMIFSKLWPRKFVCLVKKETFDKPFLKFLFDTWHGIPVNRGTADFTAFNASIKALEENKILVISPEGTRTNDGKMIKGNPGILALAQKSGTTIIPVVCYGAEEFHNNFRKLKRTRVNFVIGEPFRLKLDTSYPDRETRNQITDDMMYQLAILLPEKYRGYYSDLSKMSTNYLQRTEV
jgi:1-acyl-sn-glycerol-3-phosphate acyltransferase